MSQEANQGVKRCLESPEGVNQVNKAHRILSPTLQFKLDMASLTTENNDRAEQKIHMPSDMLDNLNELINKHYPDDKDKSGADMIYNIVGIIYSTLNKKFEAKIETLQNKVDAMENYSRRNNLIISGVPENVWNTKLYVTDLCNAMGLTEVKFERIHRLGRFIQERNRPRSIIVRFTHYEARDYIWQNRSKAKFCYDRRGSYFDNIFIEEDFTQAVKEKRKDLLPIAAEARTAEGNSATVNGDVLVINGVQYKHNELDRLPTWLQDARFGIKKDDNTMAFFRRTSYLSNHSLSSFTMPDTGKTYNCSEQFIAETCALFAKDEGTAKLITAESDPVRQKGLMRRIQNLDVKLWHDKCEELCFPGILEKFRQNKAARDVLVNTGQRVLVEAAPYDPEWGIGLGLTHPQVLNPNAWAGNNHQGNILMKIRTKLVEESLQ